MPNVVGLIYEDAQTSLQNSGVLVPSSIGYFGTWPISINWLSTAGKSIFFVTAQSPAANATVAANAAVTLTVVPPPMGVVYP